MCNLVVAMPFPKMGTNQNGYYQHCGCGGVTKNNGVSA
jgi:hypothetical protein